MQWPDGHWPSEGSWPLPFFPPSPSPSFNLPLSQVGERFKRFITLKVISMLRNVTRTKFCKKYCLHFFFRLDAKSLKSRSIIFTIPISFYVRPSFAAALKNPSLPLIKYDKKVFRCRIKKIRLAAAGQMWHQVKMSFFSFASKYLFTSFERRRWANVASSVGKCNGLNALKNIVESTEGRKE